MNQKKILCIEEFQNSSDYFTFIFPAFDVTFQSINSFNSDWIKENIFDLYFLDFRLINQDGISLCNLIRELNPNTPIVYSSNSWQTTLIKQILAAGADVHLLKPIIGNDLFDTVNSFLT